MALTEPHRSTRLIGRTLLPSATSLVLDICFSLVLVGMHVTLLALHAGPAVTGFLGTTWATNYADTIVRPLERTLSGLTFNTIATALVWAIVGMVVYFGLDFAAHAFANWRAAQKDVKFSGQTLVAHPARRSFFMAALWRLGILTLAILLLVAAQPLIQHLLNIDSHLMPGDLSSGKAVGNVMFAFVSWVVLEHCFVVILRLFLLRTRLFGDVRGSRP